MTIGVNNYNKTKEANPVVDQACRDELLDITRSFIVQAPAGSGKTELLTQRILALLAKVTKPESVLAITFTRKAAAEMRQRVTSALKMGSQPEPNSSHEKVRWALAREVLKLDKQYAWNLVDNPSRLNIYTIDALSASLSGALPLLSQTGTIPNIADKPYLFYLQAAQRTLASVKDDDSVAENIKLLLTHKDNNLKQVSELLAQLLAKRLQWLGRIDATSHELTCERLHDSLGIIIQEKLQSVYHALPINIISELPPLLEQASNVLKLVTKKSVKHLIELTNFSAIALPTDCDVRLWKGIAEMLLTANQSSPVFFKSPTKNSGFPVVKDAIDEQQGLLFAKNKQLLKDILKELSEIDGMAKLLNDVRQLPDDLCLVFDNPVLKSVVELLPIAAGHLKLVFREYNQIDFSELSLASLNALVYDDAPTDIALALDYQIEHILVDEFQDTSSPQVRLVELLTEGWDASGNKSLFLVGDPMQSIYRFRDANVSLFMKIAEVGIGNVALNFRQLKVNFRSNENIISWVNQKFTEVMPKTNDLTLSAVSYAPSIAFHPSLKLSGVRLRVTVNAEDHRAQANDILHTVQRHVLENNQSDDSSEPKTLAILARSRAHLTDIIQLLNHHSISYQALDIEPLNNKMIVSDITSLGLALTDLFDQVSWMACFRTPWFCLPLNDIQVIFSLYNTGTGSIVDVVNQLSQDSHKSDQSLLSQQGLQRIEIVMPILNNAIKQKGRKPFAKWLMGCFEAVGGLLQLDLQSEYKDLETCVSTLAEFEDGGEIIDRDGLNLALKGLYAAADPEADSQVQIMTIHKSKGLEFDRVILPRLDARGVGVDSPLLKWTEVIDRQGQSHNLLAVSKQTGMENDSIYQYINFLDKQKEKYENQRLLYVAATRAKSELYLFANVVIDEKATAKHEAGETIFKRPIVSSFLNMIWDEVQGEIEIIESQDDNKGACLAEKVSDKTPQKLTEQELSTIGDLDSIEEQLKYLFPARKIKQSGIATLERCPENVNSNSQAQLSVVDKQSHELVSNQIALNELVLNGTDSNQSARVASRVGTVIHRQLEWLSKQSLDNFVFPNNWKSITQGQLLDAGIAQDDGLEHCVDTVTRAVNNCLNDKMGRFILTPHSKAQSEVRLHKKIDSGEFLSRIIDRTFIAKGQRWIVDYKSSEPQANESLPDFISREVSSYREQLKDYLNLYKALESIDTVAGLYFPLISHFEVVFGHLPE